MTLLRRLAVFLIFVLVVAVAAAWLVVPRLDPNLFRADLTDIASARLGRSVSIDGPIHLDLLPQPTLTADKVRLGSDQGMSITAAELRLTVALWPLAAGRIDARELVLRGVDMRLPWPLDPAALMAVRTPRWLSSVTARVEDGTLVIGSLAFTGIAATLTTADSGSYAAVGSANFSGQPWRFTARLTQPGVDGSAGLDLTLDGQGPAQGIGGTLSGQIAADGTLAGRVTGRGPDLSHLFPAPAVSFEAEGRLTIAGGLAAADDLAIKIGGSPARGAVALRVSPVPRLDLALAASRLDLDAWLPVLLRSAALELPTGIDLSAEAANFAGGTLRGLRAAVDLTDSGADVREVRAILPGDAPVRISGHIARAVAAGHPPRFEGDVSVIAPALRTTLAWVQQAGVTPIASLPEGVLRTANLSAHVAAEPGQVSVAALTGRLDGSKIAGSLSLRAGKRWTIGAGLDVERLDLDPWLPGAPPPLATLPVRFAPFDVNLRLEAKQVLVRGLTVAPLSLDAGAEAGLLTLRRLDLQIDGVHATAAATIAEGGRVSEARLDIQAPQAAPLAAWLPDGMGFVAHRAPGLWKMPATVQVLGSGAPDKLVLKLTADLADLRLESAPVIDLTKATWTAATTLRHPGAPRLLAALGLGDTSLWLGDGSLGLIAELSGAPGRITADSFDLAAGGLRATGTLALDRAGAVPMLTGRIAAETLPLPLAAPRSDAPFPLDALTGFDAALTLRAGTVLADLAPVLTHAQGTLGLKDGTATLDLTRADLSGGTASGSATLSAAADPPALALKFDLAGVAVTGPVFDLPLDLTDGTLDAHAAITASGHAPAAMLATLAGQASLSVRNGALAGVSLGRMGARLRDDAVGAALLGGATPFETLALAATFERGVVTLHDASLTGTDGQITAAGDIDLPANTSDLHLQFRPAVPDPPTLGLRLTGPWAAPHRVLELAAAAAWREAHPPPPVAPLPSPSTPAPATPAPSTPGPSTSAPAPAAPATVAPSAPKP
jgi:uncharacterized protein involved in outer membrane biogenesis